MQEYRKILDDYNGTVYVRRALALGIVGWFLMFGLVLLLANEVGQNNDAGKLDWLGSLIPFSLLALFVSGPLGFLRLNRGHARRQSQAESDLEAFLARIKYSTRGRRAHSDDTEMSARWKQHLWYGDNPGLDWTDRVRGESQGIDNGDVYRNNVSENDKD